MAQGGVMRTLLLVAALLPGISMAQAWLPDAGTFSTLLVFNDTLHRDHYLPNGDEVDVGHTRVQSYGFVASYSPTDRIMLTAGIPLVSTRFWGPLPSHGGDPNIEVDDGDVHTTFTDFRLTAHYQLLEQPVALAPLVAVVIPSHDYETIGHASHGRNLNEYWVGFELGKNLAEWIPRTYTQLRYTYAFVEKAGGVSHDRSNYNLEFGTFITRRWLVNAHGAWQQTHGGIDVPIPRTHPLYPYHDLIADDEFFNVGLGTGYAVTPEISAFVTYMQGLKGRNGHKLNQGLTLGFSYGFRPRAASGAADDL